MKEVKLSLQYAGYCLAKESHAIKGGQKKEIKFHALFGLIQHPEKGWVLYDTGYTERFHEATRKYPNKIYAKMTKVFIRPEEEVIAQIRAIGIEPEEIQHVIITHFHGDHTAGLKDFPNATFYCSQKAFTQLENVSDFWAFSKGILKDFIPSDFNNRVQIIEEVAQKQEDIIFGHRYDLWGDDSIYTVDLPGHAAGQIGIQVQTNKHQYFLIADACWLKKSYTDLVLPSPIVKLFFDSWKDFKNSLTNVHLYHQANPDVIIIPTHCEESTRNLVSTTLALDVL